MFGNNKLNETQRAPVIWQRGSVMGALSHLQIVEIGSAAAASYCARLFADFGATVQKVEAPQGDPLRRTAPCTSEAIPALFMSKQAGLAVRIHTGILRRPTRPFVR